jgi:hypothetical protein
MSLKEAAQYLQSQGRGTDSRLMHVSPQELQSLQTLAMSKGGSLTINPHTGLPEAGFLEDILPVAAAGAMMAFAPEAAPFIGEGLGLGTGALGTGVGMGLLAGGAQAAGQLLTTGKLDLNSALRTGAVSGLTAGAISGLSGAPTSNVQTPVPALTNTSAPTIPGGDGGGDFTPTITTPTVTGGAQPVNSNGLSPYEKALGSSLSTTPANANDYFSQIGSTANTPTPPGVEKSWWKSLTPGQQLATGLGGVAGLSLLASANQPKIQTPATTSYIRPYTYAQTRNPNYGQPGQNYYNQSYIAQPTYKAAEGGLMGGPVEQMSQINAGQTNYPQSGLDHATYAVASQMPTSAEVVDSDYDVKTDPYTGDLKRMASGGATDSGYIPTSQAVQDYNKMLSSRAVEEYLNNPMPSAMMPASQRQQYNQPQMGLLGQAGLSAIGQGFGGQAGQPQSLAYQSGLPQYTYNPMTRSYTPIAPPSPVEQPVAAAAPILDSSGGGGKAGGLMPYNLGGYSDGGRLLKGPGDGMSDNIPASIGDKQPARLADGEFVVPADVVSHLGNGSTDAGAKKLYAMMDKVRTARTGNKKQGKEIKAEKYLKI